MSGLLGRLVGQAMGPRAGTPSRIRSAVSVHAMVPVALESREMTSQLAVAEPDTNRRVMMATELTSVPTLTATPESDHETARAAGEPPASQRAEAAQAPRAKDEHSTRERTTERRTMVREQVIAVPDRLLPETAPGPVPALAAVTPAAREAREMGTDRVGSSEPPTEVHVHIGRIDVIAAPEPAAQKKTRPTARPSVALAEYLARRKTP